MKQSSRAKSILSNANFWYGIGVCSGVAHIVALLIVLIVTGVLNFSRCPSVNGRVCNDRGTCDEVIGICTCTDPFFSGEACDVTLAPGYVVASNQVCSGQGILSTPLVNRTHIPIECLEEQPSAANGFKRSGGGWQTARCFERVQGILKSFLASDGLNVTDDELFSLPLCQCFPPYTGMACDVTSCPINSELEVCSGNGNKSVTYTHNNTQTGNGCQCDAQIVKLLSPNLGYSSFAYRQLREKSIAFRLHQPLCGQLVTHRTKPDLKLVLTQGLVQTKRLYTCRCDALHFGEACEFGVCPEVDEKICNNHGHPNVGFGFERNTTRNDPKCQPVCPPGQVLCPNTRDCRASAALCNTPASCVSANPKFPIRCRDGSCVARPLRTDTVSDYSFGFDESSLVSPVTQCFASQYADPAVFLTNTDYRQQLSDCAGDEGSVVVDRNAQPVFIPNGKRWVPSSLVSVLVEFTYDNETNGNALGVTLAYRNQRVLLVPPASNEDLHVRVALFNESYEEKADRIVRYVNQTVTVDSIGGGMVDIYPFPTMHDSSRMLPEIWSGQTVYIRSGELGTVVQIRPSSTRVEYTPLGTWFIANISDTRVVVPGGSVVPISECIEDLPRCAWNAETRLSYDGSRILCGSRTSSTNFGCTVVQPLPESYIRFEVVLTGMLLTPNLDQYDWQGQGPWFMSQHKVGNAPVSDVDFSYDGEFLFIENPNNLTVRKIEYVQLKDIIVPNACPPTLVNASTLNARWFLQSGRRKEGYIPLTGKSYAIGQILHPLKGLHLVRGLVVSNTTLQVKGYDDPVPVLTMREITPSEFRRGLQYEDVHVFPAVCADGSPAHINHQEFHNITVKCDCDASSTTALTCTCRDHLLRNPYQCTCSLPATTTTTTTTTPVAQEEDGGSCTCVAGPGETDYLYPVETYLLRQLREVRAGEADWGYCYFHDVRNQVASPITRSNKWSRVSAKTDADGAVQIQRVPGSAALLEIYLPCRRLVNQTTGETEAYNLTTVALFGRVSLYSDNYQEVPVDVLSGCTGGNDDDDDGNEIALRPILTSYFEDKFDDWIFEGPPDLAVEFKFAPGGVPIQNMTITVSSNDDDKVNVLWNDFTTWRSDEDTDTRPTLTLAFNQTRTVIGLYLVLETVGVPVFSLLDNETIVGPDVNVSMTIPVEILLEGSVDGGITWYLMETVVSSVYRGEEDVYIPFSLSKELTHLRISSEYPLGISTLMPLTNQYCSHPDIFILASSGASTLDVVSLQDIVEERAKLNQSQVCVCVDTCDLGMGILGPLDTCKDEPFVALNRSLFEPLEFPAFTFLDLFAATNLTVRWMYLGSTNLTNDEQDVAYWWSWSVAGNNTLAELPDEPEDIYQWMDSRNLTSSFSEPIGWDVDTDQVPTNDTANGYIIFRLNLSLTYTDSSGQAQPRQYNLTSDNTSIVEIRSVRLSDRGAACRAGTHCSACGPSNRISPQPLPGVKCTLSEYQERLLSDFENRTDHFYSRASLTTDFLDASATKGRFTVRKKMQFTRDTVRLSRGPCQDCDGLFRCTTGECVTNLRLCPSPVRYNCPGNGCTRVSVNDKRYSCACEVGWGGNDCSLQYCVPGDPYKGEVNPARWCSCGQFPPIKAKPPFTLPSRARAVTTAQLIRTMNSFKMIKPGDFQSYPFMPSFASFGDAILRVFLNQTTGNPRPVYTTCWFYKRGPFGQPISYFDSVIIDPDTLEVTGWRAFDTPASLNTKNDSLKATYVWSHPFAYDEFPFRCPQGACVATEDECFVEANVNPPCGVGGKCKVDGTCECFPGRTTFVYTQDWTNRSMVPYDAENPVTWGKLVVPLPNRQRCNARDCSDGRCDIPMGCFPGSKVARFADAHVACASNTGNFGMCGVDQTACRRGEVVPPGPCSYLGLPRQRDYRPDEWYCECGELRTKLIQLQDSPSASTGREVAELKKNGWGGPVCGDYYCTEITGVVRYETRDPLTLLPYVDHEQQVLAGKWTGGSCGAPIGPNPDHIIQWIACCPSVPHTSWGFARCENVLCTIASQTQCVPIQKCTGVGHRPMVYPCNGKGRPRADGTCECQTDKLAGVGYGPDESGVGCYKQITCPKARNGRTCNYAQQNAEHWTELPKVEYWESQIPMLMLREGVIPSYSNMVSRLVTGPQDMKDLILTASTRTALRVRDAITALQSCIYLHNVSDTNCSAPFGMLPYCGSESIVGPYGKGYSSPYHIQPDRVLMSNTNISARNSVLFDRLIQQIGTGVTYVAPKPDVTYILLTPSTNLTITFSDPDTTVSVVRVFGRLMNANGTAPAASSLQTNIVFSSLDDDTGEPVMVCGNMTFFGGSDAWTWGGGTNLALYCESVWREYVFDATASAYLTFCGQLPSGSTCRNWKASQCLSIPGLRLQNTNVGVSEFPGCPLTAVCCEPLTPPRPPISHLTLSLSSSSTIHNVTVAIQELVVIGYTRTSPPLSPALGVELSYLNGNRTVPVECMDELNLQRLLGENLGYYLPVDYSQGERGRKVSNQSYLTADEQCEQSGGILAASRGGEFIGDYARVYGEACFRDTSLGTGDKCLVAARNRYEPSEYKTEDFIEPDCSMWGCYRCDDGTENGCIGVQNAREFHTVPKGFESNWTTQWHPSIVSWDDVLPQIPLGGGGYILGSTLSLQPTGSVNGDFCTFTVYATEDPFGLPIFLNPDSHVSHLELRHTWSVSDVSKYNRDYFEIFGDPRFYYCQARYEWECTFNSMSCCNWLNNCYIRGTGMIPSGNRYTKVCHYVANPPSVFDRTRNGWAFSINGPCAVYMKSPGYSIEYSGLHLNGVKWLGGGKDVSFSPLTSSYTVTIEFKPGIFSSGSNTDESSLGIQNAPYRCGRLSAAVTWIKPFAYLFDLNNLGVESRVSSGYPVWDNSYITPARWITDIFREPMMVVDTAKLSSFAGWDSVYKGTGTDFALLDGIGLRRCSDLGRRVLPCTRCLKQQPMGVWEWDQRHYDPQRLRFNQPVGRMNQLSASDISQTARPQLHVSSVQWYGTAPAWNSGMMPMASLNRTGGHRALAHLLVNLRAPRDMNSKFHVDNCVAVARNPASSVDVPYSLQPVVCVAQPRHYALCMRTWLKHAVQPGRLGDKCGASCRKGAQPQPGRTAFDENALADARRFPDEHAIYQAWLQGTLENMTDLGEINYQGVWEFLRYTLNDSLVWSFDEARQFLRESKSTRPKRTSQGAAEDYHRWLDFNWRQTWPVDCGVQCSKETGVCRPMLAVSSKYCKADEEGQFPTKALVPESEFPLDLIPISDVNRTIGVARCAEMIDPSTYAQTTANGRPSPTNRDFIVLEEITREHVTLKATRAGLNSWHNTGKVDHLYQLRNDTVFYGTFACSPRCHVVQLWAHRISPFYETTNERIVLGTFNASSSGTTTFITSALGSAFNGTQYRAFGFDFFNLTRYSVVKIGVLLAHDSSTIAECTRPLSDLVRKHEEPPASIQLPNTQNECVFEYDAEDDLYRKIPGQCFCSDIAWGGPSCESPAVVTLMKGKRVCAGWGRPGYQTVRDGALVKVDEDGVWHHQGQVGCVCMNPGLIIRTRLDPITRYAYPSIFVSEKKLGDREFTYKSAVTGAGTLRPRYTYTESARICAEESGDLPWFVNSDEVDAFAAALDEVPAENNTVFVDLTREMDSGVIRWNVVGGSALFRCPDNATTPDPECGVSVGVGGLCSVDDVELCRAVHHNNLALNGTFANVTTRVVTDGRLDTMYDMPSGQSVSVSVANRLGQVANATGMMRVEVLAENGDTSFLEVLRVSNGAQCQTDFSYYQSRPSTDLKLGSIVAYVFKCPAYDTFRVRWTGFGTMQLAEVYAYDDLDENRYYNYHR